MTNFFDKVLRDAGSAERKSARKPWWQVAKTVRQGYLAGAWNAVFGLCILWAALTLGAPWLLISAASLLALAVLHIISALVLRRRERSALTPERDRPPGLPTSR